MMEPLYAAILLIAAVCLSAGCTRDSSVRAVYGGRYGNVRLIEYQEHPRGLVIFFTDRNGLNAANDEAAVAIAKAGALVAEVNTPAYLNGIDKANEKCHQIESDAEQLSHVLQRTLKFPNYLTPILTGVGEGGTLAEVALSEAPAVTIAGIVSIDPSPAIEGREPMCIDAHVQQAGRQGFSYGAVKSLQGYCIVGLTSEASKSGRNYIFALQRAGMPIEIRYISKKQPRDLALATLTASHFPIGEPVIGDVSRLPLVELPVRHPSKLMAIVISGDGGWRDLDKTIAEDLQEQGVPVVGWDSLRYFWNKKTPAQAATDFAAVIETFREKWHADKVALIGYSFGADVLPFVYNRLPKDLRSHVALVALLGLSKSADFEIRVSGWLGSPAGPQAFPVMPAAAKVPPRLIQCFYGQDEAGSACLELAKRGVQVIRTAGGHHFNGDYDALERDILAGFKRRAAAPLPSMPDPRTSLGPLSGDSGSQRSAPFFLRPRDFA